LKNLPKVNKQVSQDDLDKMSGQDFMEIINEFNIDKECTLRKVFPTKIHFEGKLFAALICWGTSPPKELSSLVLVGRFTLRMSVR
jgi:hypothetical protein